MRLFLSIFLTLLLFSPNAIADDPFARSVMEKVDSRDDGDNASMKTTMTLIDRRGAKRVRELRQNLKDMGKDTYRIMFFESPADVKNTGFLTYDYRDPEKDDDQWLYLPALKKTKRIASSDKSGSFMGSDFSYSDMTRRNLDDYDYTLLKESTVRDKKVWIINAAPRSDEVISETGYTRSVLFVGQENLMVVRAKHWLKNGKVKYLDLPVISQIDGVWTAQKLTMTTKRGKETDHKTILEMSDVKYNQNLDDDIFTTRRLPLGLF